MNRRTLFGMVVGAPLARLWRPKPEITYFLVRDPVREAEWASHAAHLAVHERAVADICDRFGKRRYTFHASEVDDD